MNILEELRKIVEAREKATGGKWHVYEVTDCGAEISRGIQDEKDSGLNRGEDCELFKADDAAFIALAGSTDWPALLAEVERLKAIEAAEIDRLQRKETRESIREEQDAGGNGIAAGDARPGIERIPASGEAVSEAEVQPSDVPISRSTSEAPPPWFAAAVNEARQKFEDAIIGDLASVANRHSLENESDTPDFILARFMRDCLLAFGKATVANTVWHSSTPGENSPPPIHGKPKEPHEEQQPSSVSGDHRIHDVTADAQTSEHPVEGAGEVSIGSGPGEVPATEPQVKRGFLICRQCGAELYEVTPMRSRLVDGPCGSCVQVQEFRKSIGLDQQPEASAEISRISEKKQSLTNELVAIRIAVGAEEDDDTLEIVKSWRDKSLDQMEEISRLKAQVTSPLWKAVGSITEPQVIEALRQRVEAAERERDVFMEETESHTTRLQTELTILRASLTKMERVVDVVNRIKQGPWTQDSGCNFLGITDSDWAELESALAALSEKGGA